VAAKHVVYIIDVRPTIKLKIPIAILKISLIYQNWHQVKHRR